MHEEYREKYLTIFENYYRAFKNNGSENYFEETLKATVNTLKSQCSDLTDDFFEGMELEVDTEYNGAFQIIKPSVLTASDNKVWFDSKPPSFPYFWMRYEKYLLKHKGWAPKTVDIIDKTTNEILKRIGNPSSSEPFDKRGLVLGHVQSGKTANFTGLINKAFDVGYKLIIVLAGMHNDLRAQTQLRLEKEVVGRVHHVTGERQGVALIKTGGKQIETWTTVQDDISGNNTVGVKNLDKPILLVVKKHKDVLPALIDILKVSVCQSSIDVPLLVIDDEADQASVDASGKKKDKPTKINQQIRELLEIFKRKSYVGYTATPFANLLIDAKVNDDEIGLDLYPKDFIVALPQPEGYCGPEEFFNTTGYLEDNKPLFIRHLSNEDIELLDQLRTKDDGDLFTHVPSSMQQAIFAFLISIAVRSLRGQEKVHNSMLIHTSRFTDVQNSMSDVIESFCRMVTNDICYNDESEYIEKLKNLYETDFLEVQSASESAKEFERFAWKDVYQKIIESLKGKSARGIVVMEINGESDDALEYDKFKESGLNVIAVGGNKLSRGLTLEGLTISYYYRGTSMYDTLMQMGRWFGYRTGYMDLCRIYTSPEIAENFEYLAIVMKELRDEFEKYVEKDITPSEYAARMKTHPTMSVTSPTKMGTAESPIDYAESMQQTRSFETNRAFFENNMEATVKFINSIEKIFEKTGKNGSTKYHLVKNIPSELVVNYLNQYKTLSTARIVNSKKIASYIIDRGIAEFNVAIVEGTPSTYKKEGVNIFPVNLGGIKLESAVTRSMAQDKSKNTAVVDLGAIVAANQEFIDIENRTKSKKENILLRNNENPLLLIYPLHPEAVPFKKLNIPFNENFVPIGLAFSFPNIINDTGIDNPDRVRESSGYIYNNTVGERKDD